jgi:hypothetical protein
VFLMESDVRLLMSSDVRSNLLVISVVRYEVIYSSYKCKLILGKVYEVYVDNLISLLFGILVIMGIW